MHGVRWAGCCALGCDVLAEEGDKRHAASSAILLDMDVDTLMQLPAAARLCLIFMFNVFGSGLAMYFSSRHLPLGWRRAPLALVIIILDVFSPFLFAHEEVCTKVLVCLNFVWLGSFKVAGWALGRGPLCGDTKLTLAQFTAVLGLPITPVLTAASKGNARQHQAGHEHPLEGAAGFAAKLVALCAITLALSWPPLPILAQEFAYILGLYCFVGLMCDLTGAFTTALLDLPIAPHFDRPYLSSSFTDYWSRRWNLNTGYTCRFLVYDVVLEGQLVKAKRRPGRPARPSAVRRSAAVCAAFVMSATMHELFLLYLRGRLSGYWMAFFTLQGPLVLTEAAARRWLRARGVKLPQWFAVPLTLGGLLAVGHLLFFPDILRMGLPQQVHQSLMASVPPALRGLIPGGSVLI